MATRPDIIRKVRIPDVSFNLILALIFTAQVVAKGTQCTAKRHKRRKLESEHKQPKDTSLHPSWEASRRRKEQESKLARFQGQRTIFSDSD